MKAYVIKNKENDKYWTGFAWDNNLTLADLYKNTNEYLSKNEYWQEITIAEGDLEKQLAEKNKRIEKLKDKMETWQSELFDKLTEVTQMIDDYSVEIPMGDKTPSLMLIGSKEFENVIDEIIDKFTR